MDFKDIITTLDKLTLNQMVSILVLIESSLDIDTISQTARNENKTPRGIKISSKYKKVKIGKQTFAITGLKESPFPF